MNNWFVFFFYVQLVCSCNSKSNVHIIAKVYDAELTLTELSNELKNKNILKDSQKYADVYINNWIINQVILKNAGEIEIKELNSIEEKAEKYKNKLLVHYFQNKLIEERLDTSILEKEIIAFLNNHKSDFQLKDYLVKVLYIKVAEDAPELENLGKWYKLKKETDEANILQYARMYANNFYYDKTNWISHSLPREQAPQARENP